MYSCKTGSVLPNKCPDTATIVSVVSIQIAYSRLGELVDIWPGIENGLSEQRQNFNKVGVCSTVSNCFYAFTRILLTHLHVIISKCILSKILVKAFYFLLLCIRPIVLLKTV